MAKILVIDDDSSGREFLADLLRSRGHVVFEAGEGRQGLELAERERPDLIFSDMLMPMMDGFEFARRLRGEPAIAATPVIFYTASYHGAEAERLAETCGVARLLTKPAEAAVILQAVEEVLSHGAKPPEPPREAFDRAHLQLVTDTLARTADRLRLLHEIDRALLGSRSQQEIAEVSAAGISRLIPCERATVLEFDAAAEYATILAARPEAGLAFPRGTPFRLAEVADVAPMIADLRQGRIHLLDLAKGAAASSESADRLAPGGRFCWVIPLIASESLIGCLTLRVDRPDELSRPERDIALEVGAQMAVAIENRRSTAALRAALGRAEAADRLRMAFLANMSHEIRTPLNVILGYADLLCAEFAARGEPSSEELVSGIQRGSQRLISTMQSIFDVAKLESGTFEYRPTALSVPSVIEQVTSELRPAARAKDLSLTLEIEEPNAVVTFDRYCLSRSVHHLVENAIKFTTRGGVTVRLLRGADRALAIEVEDSGVGIDPAYFALLFKPFSQEESGYTRRFEGSGLGLALAKRFLELGHARISFTSAKGRGTKFTIGFDVSSETHAAAAEPTPPTAREDDACGGTRTAVLVIEDDPDTQAIMEILLRSRYRVFRATTGEEARAVLADHADSIALVLMDLSLKGGEDGLDLTRALRRDPAFRRIPIIATTAHASAADRERCLAAGCDAYLAKPVTRLELFSLIETIG